jgi:transcriptional regulator with XRE-family HTH domain
VWTVTQTLGYGVAMARDAKSPGEVIGQRMRAIREEHGERQDEVAAVARDYGLNWTRATVAAIETGRREVSVAELLALPHILGVPVWDLFPTDATVRVGPDSTMTGAGARATFAGSDVTFADFDTPAGRAIARGFRSLARHPDRLKAAIETGRRVWPQASARDVLEARRDAEGEVDRRAADRLGVDARALALAARRKWGHGLTAERDRRTPAGVTSTGHITRALLAELRPLLEAAGLIEKED